MLVAIGVCFGSFVGPQHSVARAGDAQPEQVADLKAKIDAAVARDTGSSLNEAMRLLKRLSEACADAAAREAVGYTAIEARTVAARDKFFSKAVQPAVFRVMTKLIAAKAREKKGKNAKVPPAAAGPGAGPAAIPIPGTLAAARQWLVQDLEKQIWESLSKDMGLTLEELERFWKSRTERTVRRASYGTGTFIVMARKAPVDATSEEAWWEKQADDPIARAEWLTAHFVETSGAFEVVRVDESEMCRDCGGRGVNVVISVDGSTQHHICPTCSGSTKVLKVEYR